MVTSLITCPGCTNKLTLPDTFIGQRVKCPKCETDFEAQPEAKLALDPAPPPEPAKPLPLPEMQGAYAPLGSAPTAPPRMDAEPMRYCIECGARFPRSEEACPACGLAVHAMIEERTVRRARPRLLLPLRGTLPILCVMTVPLAFAFLILMPIFDTTMRNNRGLSNLLMGLAGLASGLCVLLGIVFFCIWLYQAWRLMSHEDAEYSPGLMVGLLFVPFFNLYWLFHAVPGLSTAIQQELHYLAPNRPHNTGWVPGLIACILMLIPYFQPIAACFFIAWMLIANNALHRLIRYHERLREEEIAMREKLESR